MNEVSILLTNRKTNGGESIKANIRTSKDWIYIDFINKIDLTVSIPKNAILKAIEEK